MAVGDEAEVSGRVQVAQAVRVDGAGCDYVGESGHAMPGLHLRSRELFDRAIEGEQVPWVLSRQPVQQLKVEPAVDVARIDDRAFKRSCCLLQPPVWSAGRVVVVVAAVGDRHDLGALDPAPQARGHPLAHRDVHVAHRDHGAQALQRGRAATGHVEVGLRRVVDARHRGHARVQLGEVRVVAPQQRAHETTLGHVLQHLADLELDFGQPVRLGDELRAQDPAVWNAGLRHRCSRAASEHGIDQHDRPALGPSRGEVPAIAAKLVFPPGYEEEIDGVHSPEQLMRLSHASRPEVYYRTPTCPDRPGSF